MTAQTTQMPSTRTCAVKAHSRKLPERLDTETHRILAKECNWKPTRKTVRVKATSRKIDMVK